jgi:DNA-binding NarL/FixJ family response regulator
VPTATTIASYLPSSIPPSVLESASARQIAQTLFLTVKTIETHLAAAYDKLGIRSRRELPQALHEPPEQPLPAIR